VKKTDDKTETGKDAKPANTEKPKAQ
jgi:hypothetical protein